MIEKKVLYNVLRAIQNGESGRNQAPDNDYLKSLEQIGFIEIAWDNKLTGFGLEQLNWLRDQIEK